MTREDFEQLAALGRALRELEPCGLLSPAPRRARTAPWRRTALTEHDLFPNARGLSRRDWDLREVGAENFALLVASNVFMYASEPALWLANVLASCRHLVLLDLVRRRRRPDSEFGSDGDCMRYAIGTARPRVDTFYDLNEVSERICGYRTYSGGASEYDPEPLHFVALLRGDLPTDGAAESVVQRASRALSPPPGSLTASATSAAPGVRS